MDASLLFSKLAPYLGNLAPGAIQPILNEPISWQTDNTSSITCCVWIPDTHLSALDKWIGIPGCPSSVLVTTTHAPGSSAHKKLIRETREIVRRKRQPEDTVILISSPLYLPNPNTYINLARLFSKSPWSLLVPPERDPVLPSQGLSDVASRMELRVQPVDYRELFDTSGLEERLYVDALLVPRDSPTWCTEHYLSAHLGQEWLECARQFLS
ncbi:hypothetical protein FRC12_021550 [Ceratobasidium sp. 428]|nr:hypothetical protein FRC12_021550 [Ceratobasidium sp. 428]